jgi:hypothetical protein
MIVSVELKREKRHECTNMGKQKNSNYDGTLFLTSLPVWDLEKFKPLDFYWTECA